MTIHRLIQKLAFNQDDIERLAAAYEEALRALHISDRDDPINKIIAQRIIEAAAWVCAIRLLYARWPSRTLLFRKVRLLLAHLTNDDKRAHLDPRETRTSLDRSATGWRTLG
jgi:hypothetical protein